VDDGDRDAAAGARDEDDGLPPEPHRLDPHLPDPDEDGLDAARQRIRRRIRALLAAVAVVALVVPLGGWLVDELTYRVSGREVAAELGADAELVDALLLVRAGRCDGRVSTGSAFVVDLGDGPVVVTNRHVVEAARSVGVRPFAGGAAITVTAVRVSDVADVAVLEVADPSQLPSPLATGRPVAEGDDVRLVGFPAAQPFTSRGVVASAAPGALVVDLVTDPGASGSPVVDEDGLVVGQVFARTVDGQGIATPVTLLADAVRGAVPAEGC
jgi:S1-C subfamily serine protease